MRIGEGSYPASLGGEINTTPVKEAIRAVTQRWEKRFGSSVIDVTWE